MTTFPPS